MGAILEFLRVSDTGIFDPRTQLLYEATVNDGQVVEVNAHLSMGDMTIKGESAARVWQTLERFVIDSPGDTYEGVFGEIVDWGQFLVDQATALSFAHKLYEEATEVRVELLDFHNGNTTTDLRGEMADVIIVMVLMAQYFGVDLLAAVKSKLEKNKARQWGNPDPDTGVIKHVKEIDA